MDVHFSFVPGCVNCCSFVPPDGTILVSGSDDLDIILWDWQNGNELLKFNTIHESNIFQAKVLPHRSDTMLITCAHDGLVTKTVLPEGASAATAAMNMKVLGSHDDAAHKIAGDPENRDCFMSCAEDGSILSFDVRERRPVVNRMSVPWELYSVNMNPLNPVQCCLAGRTDKLHVIDRRKSRGDSLDFVRVLRPLNKPYHKRQISEDLGVAHSNNLDLSDKDSCAVTCAMYDSQGQILASYNDPYGGAIYLFARENAYPQERSYAAGPAEEAMVVFPAQDKGRRPLRPGDDTSSSSGDDNDDDDGSKSCSHAEEVEAPMWMKELNTKDVVQVYQGAVNCLTIKGVTMSNDEDYVLTGSEDGCLYIFEKKTGRVASFHRRADRVTVNCIEVHPGQELLTLATSGIDNDIKIWEPEGSTRLGTQKDLAGRLKKQFKKRRNFMNGSLLL